MADSRIIWLPKFDPSAKFVVLRTGSPIAGRKYQQNEEFDKNSVPARKLQSMYEARIIAPVRSDSELSRVGQDFRRQSRGKRIVSDDVTLPTETTVVEETSPTEETVVLEETVEEIPELSEEEKEAAELEELRTEASKLRIDVDPRWRHARLKKEISEEKRRMGKRDRKRERTAKK